jgi:hypothetical protein
LTATERFRRLSCLVFEYSAAPSTLSCPRGDHLLRDEDDDDDEDEDMEDEDRDKEENGDKNEEKDEDENKRINRSSKSERENDCGSLHLFSAGTISSKR